MANRGNPIDPESQEMQDLTAYIKSLTQKSTGELKENLQ
jgi:hypothetical protein